MSATKRTDVLIVADFFCFEHKGSGGLPEPLAIYRSGFVIKLGHLAGLQYHSAFFRVNVCFFFEQ